MNKTLLVLFSIFLCFSCVDNNNNNNDEINTEDETVVINNSLYNKTITNTYSITDVQLNGNLLTIKIGSSGCDGNSWKAVLVDADEILESFPVQRNIKLSLENNEACLAVFEKEFTFDISILKEGFDQVSLNLDGWNTQINYN